MKRVFICSPYAGDVERNIRYARRAMAHSLSLGEAPFAPHLLYTQEGVLDDSVASQRELGMAAGSIWLRICDILAIYDDFGISYGMNVEITHANFIFLKTEFRKLPKELLECVMVNPNK